MRSYISLLIALGLIFLVSPMTIEAVSTRPNIIVIMLDDMPPVDSIIRTMPKMGAFFAENGTTFTHDIGNDPLCCPARASFMTGLYSHHTGVIVQDATLFNVGVTIQSRLKTSGYFTMLAGKYLNNFQNVADKKPYGWSQTAIQSDGDYYNYDLWHNGIREHHAASPADYSTDVIADYAISMLRMAPANKPIYAVLTPFAPHVRKDSDPGSAKEALPAPRHNSDPRCNNIGYYENPAFNEADMSDKPTFMRSWSLLPTGGKPLTYACRAILSVDEMFNRIRSELAAQGRIDNTLFILTADNGMGWGEHRWLGKNVPFATPIPLYVRWNGHTTARNEDAYVQLVDLAPTVAEVGGVILDNYPTGQSLPDGRSILSTIDSGIDPNRPSILIERPHEQVAYGLPSWYGLRTTNTHSLGLWQYVEWGDGQRELYDLRNDPYMLDNLANDSQHDEIIITLHRELEALK